MQIEWMGIHKKNVYRVGHNGKVSRCTLHMMYIYAIHHGFANSHTGAQ